MKTADAVFFPLDERWHLTESVYSASCAQQMVWLSGLLPYEHCQAVFERIGKLHIPSSSIWRRTQQYGAGLEAEAQHQRGQVNVERVVLPAIGQDHAQQKGLSLDGGMVNIREEGWKEFKVGTVFDVEQRLERDARTGELVDHAHGVNITYTAVLGSVEHFAPALWALAVAHQVPTARDSSVSADGAEWIWNLVADYFPDSVQIVDWFHATQHLAQAAQALYPCDEKKAHCWFAQRCDDLFLGTLSRIIQPLEQHGLANQAHYFQVHQRRMQYQDFQERGYPIGSGTVESGVKQFKTRLTGPGMRWSRPAAQRMLIIRAAVLQNNFDVLWQSAA